jgi:hypothetical protein
VNLARLRPGDWVTGVAGLASVLLLWAPWYGVSDGTITGWQAFSVIDLFIVVTAALAIALLIITASRDTPELPVAMDVITAPIASLTALLVLIRLLDLPYAEVTTGREWGVFAGTAAAIAVAAGAWMAMRDERAPALRPGPEVRTMPSPPATAVSEEPS